MDVLVVLGQTEHARLLEEFLVAQGHASRVAGGAREAYGALLARLPDLLILDVDLPDLSGTDVLEATRDVARGAVVTAILVSANPFVTRVQTLGLDPWCILGKPVDTVEIFGQIREVADGRERRAPARGPMLTTIPPAPVPLPEKPRPRDDDIALLGLAPGATREQIVVACARQIEHYMQLAQGARSLEARAQAAQRVARVRAARTTLLGSG